MIPAQQTRGERFHEEPLADPLRPDDQIPRRQPPAAKHAAKHFALVAVSVKAIPDGCHFKSCKGISRKGAKSAKDRKEKWVKVIHLPLYN